jgi:hypothetical protein
MESKFHTVELVRTKLGILRTCARALQVRARAARAKQSTSLHHYFFLYCIGTQGFSCVRPPPVVPCLVFYQVQRCTYKGRALYTLYIELLCVGYYSVLVSVCKFSTSISVDYIYARGISNEVPLELLLVILWRRC